MTQNKQSGIVHERNCKCELVTISLNPIEIIKKRVEQLETALKPLSDIADEWENDGLDEDRQLWKERVPFHQVELYCGRGGKCLITLAHAMIAREVLKGIPIPTLAKKLHPVSELIQSKGLCGILDPHEKQVCILLKHDTGPHGWEECSRCGFVNCSCLGAV